MTKPRVLVADDVPLNFMVVEDLLLHAGCQPVFAANGREAIEKFLQFNFQLILLDLRMPVMDGLSTARLIRHIESHQKNNLNQVPRTPMIMVSASLDDRRTALAAGCDDYLLKPLDQNALAQTFVKYLVSAESIASGEQLHVRYG